MTTVLFNLRHALRSLRKSPGFTAAALVTIALGIGATTAIFSVVNGVLLRPLPYRDPARLLIVTEALGQRRGLVTAPDFVDLARQSRLLEVAAITGMDANLAVADEPERVRGGRVSAQYFPLLGVEPRMGRLFLASEDAVGAPRVVLLSEELWRRRFGADPHILGRTVALNGEPHTVVGVMPRGLRLRSTSAELWVPLALTPDEIAATGSHFLQVVARMRPGVGLAQTDAELRAIAATLAQVRPWSNGEVTFQTRGLEETLVGDSRASLLMLLGAVGFMLLIACANVAGLLLARATTRHREFAIRSALGAGRRQIVAQLLTESLVLSLLGGAIGVLAAVWGTDVIAHILPGNLPRLDQIRWDGGVLGFAIAAAVLTGVLFGLAPAFAAARSDVSSALKEGVRGTGGPAHHRLRSIFVVGELGLALMLLVGSGLLLQSFVRLRSVDPGFEPRHLVSLRLSPLESSYRDPAQAVALYDQIAERVRALPGVQSAGLTTTLPLDDGGAGISLYLPGITPKRREDTPTAYLRFVGPDYARTLGVHLVRGRDIDVHDQLTSQRVVVINQTMARRYWSKVDPIGQQFTMDDGDSIPMRVIGVVTDVRHFGLDAGVEPEMFLPFTQAIPMHWSWNGLEMTLVCRAQGDAARIVPAVRQVVHALDPTVAVYRVTTMERLVDESVGDRRTYAALLTIFASLALLLAAVGTYGLVAYSVGQRTHEIGIRMALGADRAHVLRLVVKQGVLLAGFGILAGLVGAGVLTRALSGLLFGVTPTDPVTFTLEAALLGGAALLATWLPARRAARVDPMVALRQD